MAFGWEPLWIIEDMKDLSVDSPFLTFTLKAFSAAGWASCPFFDPKWTAVSFTVVDAHPVPHPK